MLAVGSISSLPFPTIIVMSRFFRLLPVISSLVLLLSTLGTRSAFAQGATTAVSHVYEYTTLTTFESTSKATSKIFITPAFQGKTEVQLEDFNAFAFEKNREKFQQNAQAINQLLGDLSAAGWELVQVYPLPTQGIPVTRYLLRKAK